MKLKKMILIGTMALVPTLAMGIAQQDPAAPQQPAAQQLQQNQATSPEQHWTGVIMEVRDDSFSLRTDDQGTVWFVSTPELKSASASELVTGNRVTVHGSASATPDRMNAARIERAAGEIAADTDTDVDTDIDVDVDEDSVTADLDTDVDTDTEIADTDVDADLRDDDADFDTDSDELPRTASSLPALGSLGLLALLGAVAIGFARRF